MKTLKKYWHLYLNNNKKEKSLIFDKYNNDKYIFFSCLVIK